MHKRLMIATTIDTWITFWDSMWSYGDLRLLHEAPGHLCLDFEVPELVTLIQLCTLFGWDTHLISTFGYGQAFLCHDEWVDLGFDCEKQYKETLQAFRHAGLEVSCFQ